MSHKKKKTLFSIHLRIIYFVLVFFSSVFDLFVLGLKDINLTVGPTPWNLLDKMETLGFKKVYRTTPNFLLHLKYSTFEFLQNQYYLLRPSVVRIPNFFFTKDYVVKLMGLFISKKFSLLKRITGNLVLQTSKV